jgi:hypothetical protein
MQIYDLEKLIGKLLSPIDKKAAFKEVTLTES